MKIQNTSGWHNLVDTTSNTKGEDTIAKKNFGQLLNGHLTSRPSVDDDITAVRTGCTVLRTLSGTKDDGIRNLIKDSFSDINKDILSEIDILLDESAADNIDITSVNELLDLCIDPTQS